MEKSNKNIRNTILFLIAVLVALGVYHGAYCPLIKAKLYMIKSRELGGNQYNSLNELKQNYDQVFDYPSPVGQEEAINYFVNDIMTLISQSEQSENASRLLVEYVESNVIKDNLLQELHLGHFYFRLWERFGDQEYFQKAEEYYTKVLKEAPHLPHALEALFKMYKKAGQTEKMKEIGGKILELWPSEEKVKQAIEEGF